MRAFQVMARHRFVDRQQLDHPRVVFAQERFDLLRRSSRPGSERSRSSVSWPLSSGPGESQYATATPRWNSGIRMILTGSSGTVTRFFARTNAVASAQRLLRGGSTTSSRAGCSAYASSSAASIAFCCCAAVGRRGVAGAPGRVLQHLPRDRRTSARARVRVRLRPAARISARDSDDIEREPQLLVVQLLADAEIALRIGHQRLVEPVLLLGDGLAQVGDGGVQPGAIVAARACRRVRDDELVDQAQDAGVLLGHGLRRGSRARAPDRGSRASARSSAESSPAAPCRRSRSGIGAKSRAIRS